jgi:outer membrane lipoprotein-sorting protein
MPYNLIMPNNRTIAILAMTALAPLWARAQTPPPAAAPAPDSAAAPEPPTEAEKALDAAIAKVAALKSVSAVVVQKVEMLNQRFEIKGRYLKAPENRLYLRLDVYGLTEAPGKAASGTTLQVCDGETLWDYQKVLESQVYRKLRIVPILKKLGSTDLDPELREQVVKQLDLAGPEILLDGLRKSIKFDQKEAGTIDGRKVWVLRGSWKNRDGLLGPNQQPLPPNAPLPAYVPSLASVWVDQRTGWPYKLVLLGKTPSILQDTRRIGPDGRPIGARSAIDTVNPSDITLLYSDVKLNPEWKADDFAFQAPPSARVEDNTEAILTRLEQYTAMKAAQKKSEAAKGSLPDETLRQPIPVPKPALEKAK